MVPPSRVCMMDARDPVRSHENLPQLPPAYMPHNGTDVPSQRVSSLSALFSPQSVAVVGASDNSTRIGRRLLRDLITGGFTGQVAARESQAGDRTRARGRIQCQERA